MLATSKFGISSKRIVAQLIVRFTKVPIVLLYANVDPVNTYTEIQIKIFRRTIKIKKIIIIK